MSGEPEIIYAKIEREDRRDTALDIRDNAKAKRHGAVAVFVRRERWCRCFACGERIRPRVGRYEATAPTEMDLGAAGGERWFVVVCVECWEGA